MKCDSCLEHLDEYADGAMPQDQKISIEQHIAACTSCKGALEELRALTKAAGDLSREIDPEHDLWPQIANRIGSRPVDWSGRRPTGPRALKWLQLAAVVGLVVVGLMVARSQFHEDSSRHTAEIKARGEATLQTFADHANRAHTEDGVMLAKVDLLSTIAQRRDVLDEQTLRQIEADMLLLEQAIGQIRAALVEQPDNRKLKLALAARYQQEIRFLQQVSRV